MKKMKFLVAILAIAFVVIGSAFTTRKPVANHTYGVITQTTGFVGVNNAFREYQVYDETDPSFTGFTGFCSSSASQRCSFEVTSPIEISVSGTPTQQEQQDYNLIIKSLTADANGVMRYTIWVKAGYVINSSTDLAGPATEINLQNSQLYNYF